MDFTAAAHTVFETQHPMLPGLASVAAWITVAATSAWVAARWAGFHRFFYGDAHEIVHQGRPDKGLMQRLGLSPLQLEAELRKQGLQSVAEAKSVTLELDGSLAITQTQSAAAELRRLADAVSAMTARLEAMERKTGP